MKSVWKFPFQIADKFTMDMPEHAKPLTVQMQGSMPTMWALVDTDARLVPTRFVLVGTGHALRNGGDYIGTIQAHLGLVWHVFRHDGRP